MADSKDKKDLPLEDKSTQLDEMLNQAENQIDDFADDPVEQLLVKDEFDEKDLDEIKTNLNTQESDFSDEIISQEQKTDPVDLVMDEFDISSDENLSSSESDIDKLKVAETSSVKDDQIDLADELLEEASKDNKTEVSVSQDGGKENAEIAGLHAQINQIWADNEELKEEITALSTKALAVSEKNSFTTEQVDNLQKEQRKLAKSIKENGAKPPMLTYIALGLALLSLLTGGILGAMGLGASSDVAGLTELVTTLEEEIEILTANNSKTGVKQMDEKIKLLVAKDDFLNNKLEALDNDSEPVFLKSVFDDLVKQSDDSKQTVAELTAKVDKLEQGKPSIVRKAIVKKRKPKSKAKKVIVKKGWGVNLVSFRQKWYAQNKLREFSKKNVSTKLIPVKVKGETWYRLRVNGFKNEKEANNYAIKVKKMLNLGSVWVTKG